ncbi:MAG: hypothetical protein J6M47_06945 [Clostridia bacterium]|nr:hypothetical protein [Clostridia bacterium]
MDGKRMDKHTLKNHWHYSWWKYALLCAIGFFGVNILFTVTAYRVPEEKKIELYVCSSYVDSIKLQEFLWPMILEASPEQEELLVASINLTDTDPYTRMQFTTYTAAQQGDVLILPRSEFQSMASDGAEYAFVNLQPYIDSGRLSVDGIDLSAGVLKNTAGQEGIYGIPVSSLYGLIDYNCDPWGGILCVTSYSMNEENAVLTADLLMDTMSTEKPEGYDEMHNQSETQKQQSSQLYF